MSIYEFAGTVAALVTAAGGFFATVRYIARNAAHVTQNVDPNVELLEMMAEDRRRINRLERDNEHSKRRQTDLERDLAEERERSDRQDGQISTLQDENRELHRQLSLLQRAVAAWETWHRWLVQQWHIIRQDPTPPDGPQFSVVDEP